MRKEKDNGNRENGKEVEENRVTGRVTKEKRTKEVKVEKKR